MGIEIYKFGGASVKDADAIKNLTKIIQKDYWEHKKFCGFNQA